MEQQEDNFIEDQRSKDAEKEYLEFLDDQVSFTYNRLLFSSSIILHL